VPPVLRVPPVLPVLPVPPVLPERDPVVESGVVLGHASGPDPRAPSSAQTPDVLVADRARAVVPISSVERQVAFPTVIGPVPPVQAITVVIDAEAFARVFATTVTRLIRDRTPPPGPYALPLVQHVAPPPAVSRQSLSASARHLDVMLLGLTTLVVLVVLAAWLS